MYYSHHELIEIVLFPIGPNMETTSIRPWATLTDDKEFHIRQNKIIYNSNLKERTRTGQQSQINQYHQFVFR